MTEEEDNKEVVDQNVKREDEEMGEFKKKKEKDKTKDLKQTERKKKGRRVNDIVRIIE